MPINTRKSTSSKNKTESPTTSKWTSVTSKSNVWHISKASIKFADPMNRHTPRTGCPVQSEKKPSRIHEVNHLNCPFNQLHMPELPKVKKQRMQIWWKYKLQSKTYWNPRRPQRLQWVAKVFTPLTEVSVSALTIMLHNKYRIHRTVQNDNDKLKVFLFGRGSKNCISIHPPSSHWNNIVVRGWII